MTGLYVHVPFCVRKCRYCDFYSVPSRRETIPAYIQALLAESRRYAGITFSTLYLGGGTPSLLGVQGLTTLIGGLHHNFDLSGLLEATIEVNPESAAGDLLEAARGAGIDRLSIGVQSLSDSELSSVGRIHSALQARQAVSRAIALGFRTSADLIVGLPGQGWSSLSNSIESLVGLGVEHLSVYCLSLEEGTPLAASPPDNLPSEDNQAELFEQARALLIRRGFVHYEISNFALLGSECRHNLNYWRGGEYLGLGPGAASHLSGRRFRNRPDLDTYLNNPTGMVTDLEELDTKCKAAEEAMLRLRLLGEGLAPADLTARFGNEALHDLTGRLRGLAGDGMLTFDGSTYRLAPGRVLTANPIFAAVLPD